LKKSDSLADNDALISAGRPLPTVQRNALMRAMRALLREKRGG
jgi:hypothetical protein